MAGGAMDAGAAARLRAAEAAVVFWQRMVVVAMALQAVVIVGAMAALVRSVAHG